MNSRFILIGPILLLTIPLLAPGPVGAWDEEGHIVIARIAFDHLSSSARTRLENELAGLSYAGSSYSDPLQAARLMDQMRLKTAKKTPHYFEGLFASWHYITVPFAKEIAVLPAGSEPDANGKADVIRGWCFARDVIVSRTNRTVNYEDQVQFEVNPSAALAMIIHLTGDAHQPLHTTSHQLLDTQKEDFGGNSVTITNAAAPYYSDTRRLHSLWDSAYRMQWQADGSGGRAIEDEKFKIKVEATLNDDGVKVLAKTLTDQYPPTAAELDSLSPDSWVRESHRIGHELGYESLGQDQVGKQEVTVTEKYVTAAHDISCRRVVLAGRRLALVLEALLKKPGN